MSEYQAAAMVRVPPRVGLYLEAAMHVDVAIYAGFTNGANPYSVRFVESVKLNGITAEQAREAAHLLNQLAEYLEST